MAFFDTTWYVNFGDGSTTGYYSVPVWPGALTSVAAGTWCRQLATPTVGNERCFVCVTAGLTGAAEPVWVVTRGADSAANIDGTVKWMECTGMAGPCGDLPNAPVWVASRNVTVGEVYYDSVSASLQAATTGGTSKSGTQPSFSATAGVTTTDNTVTWTSLGPTSNYTTAFKYPHARLANAFASTWGAAGNKFGVSSIHAETQSTAITLNGPGIQTSGCAIYCISNTSTLSSPVLTTGANVSTTGASGITIGVSGVNYYYGLQFNSGSGSSTASITTGSTVQTTTVFENCVFNINNTSVSSFIVPVGATGIPTSIVFKNCSFIFGATAQAIRLTNGAAYFQGGSIAKTGSVPSIAFNGNTGVVNGTVAVIVRDMDLSALTGVLVGVNTIFTGGFEFQNCLIASGIPLTSGSFSALNQQYVKFHNCDSSNTNYRYYYATYQATVQQETVIVRTGSLATDGTTPISWNVTSTATSSFLFPFTSEYIAQWSELTSGSRTATFYLTSNTTLTNADFWVEVETLSTSGSPLGVGTDTRQMPLVSGTALTTDTSTWGGAITNKYTVVLTYTAVNKGPVKARFYIAKPSVTVYVDPYIYIT